MYIQRKDTVTLGAGDAKAVNAATHVIDPWPRYVGNRRIPGNGDRLSRAVERYSQGSYRQPAPLIAPVYGSTIGVSGEAGAVVAAEGDNEGSRFAAGGFDPWLTWCTKIRRESGRGRQNPIENYVGIRCCGTIPSAAGSLRNSTGDAADAETIVARL